MLIIKCVQVKSIRMKTQEATVRFGEEVFVMFVPLSSPPLLCTLQRLLIQQKAQSQRVLTGNNRQTQEQQVRRCYPTRAFRELQTASDFSVLCVQVWARWPRLGQVTCPCFRTRFEKCKD